MLSNFFYGRGFDVHNGSRYPPEYAAFSGRSSGRYDMHIIASEAPNRGKRLLIEIWGGGQTCNREEYEKTRKLKEAFHAGNTLFVGIDFMDCYSEDVLKARFAPFIGLPGVVRVAREADRVRRRQAQAQAEAQAPTDLGSSQGTANTTDRPGLSPIVELCTRFSECDLALFVRKMNLSEIDSLCAMDMAAIDDWIAAECPPARRERIKPLHMVSVSLDQLRERVLAELRLSLHGIDDMTKPQMI
ncbi:g954 [Coccomyxa elongata]